MRGTLLITWLLGAATAAACGGGDAAPGNDDDDDTSGPDDNTRPDAGGPADAEPARACKPAPERIIVVGDSITACSVVGGPNDAACVSKQLADYVIAEYAPGASYENHAVGGAELVDLEDQLAGIPAGDGPALIVAYLGGNNLAPYIFASDNAALEAWEQIQGEMRQTWTSAIAALADDPRFPDGVTWLMNTQYSPFDECTASPYNLSAVKHEIIRDYNDTLVSIANDAGDAAIIARHYEGYLGHGHHVGVADCPHYAPGTTPFMRDTIHANAAGNAFLATNMQAAADRLYRDCE